MRIYEYSYGGRSPEFSECVLALGFFDGVHSAHRALIERASAVAKERGLPLGVFTFPSGDAVKSSAQRIYGDDEKLKIFESLGVDFTVLCNFDSVCTLEPSEFVLGVLIRDFKCRVCAAGFNFRFGKGASGDINALVSHMKKAGAETVICDELTKDGATVSSSRIRELLTSGDTEEAAALLGSPYFLLGKVAHGNAEGRRLGYPTVNISIDESRLVPRLGVYSSAVPIDGRIYAAVTNVGNCPTLGSRRTHAETYIIDFDGDLYGREIQVYLLSFLRDERRFDNAEALKTQINIDKNRAISEKGGAKWQELGLK